MEVDGHGHTQSQVVVTFDIWGQTQDALMRELASVVLQVLSVVNHEEGVGEVNLGDTVTICQGIIYVVAGELVLIGDLYIKSQLESDVVLDSKDY